MEKQENSHPYTPWHPIFEYILEILLPDDVFDLETEFVVGKLPLKIDFIVIKKVKNVRADLPPFLDFLNDYEYAVVEYKHPQYYYKFEDFLKLFSYSLLFLIKKKLTNLKKVIRVAVFNNLETDFMDLLGKNHFKIREVKKGLYLVYNKLEDVYFINLEIIDKKEKALLLSFFSQNETEYYRAMNELAKSPSYKVFIAFIHYLIHTEDFMRLKERDKEWARRMNLTLEEFVQELEPELRLKGLSPEKILKQYSLEEVIKQYSPEEVIKQYSLEEIFSQFSLEEIENFLKKHKEK